MSIRLLALLFLAGLAHAVPPDIASDDKWLTYDSPNTSLANASTWYTGLSTTTKENTKAIIARIYWSAIEGTDGTGTTSGTFYHTAITNFLDTVETSHATLTNDPCVLIFVMARKFNNTSVAIPYDWTTGVATTTNVIPKDLVDADYEFLDGTTHTGAMWATTVRTRYQKALQGIYTAFGAHAAFCGVTSSETAGMMSYTGNPVAYSLSAYTDELEALNEAMSDTAEAADLWWNPMVNFISGANTDALRKAAWDEIYDTVATTHTIIGFPDLLRSGSSNFNGVNNQVYEMVEESYGDAVTTRLQDFKQVGHFQNDSYGDNGTGGEGPGGLFTMEQMRKWAEDTFSHVTVLAYTHQNFEAQTYDTARTGYDLGDGLAAQIRPWGAPILGGDTYLFTQVTTASTSDKNVDFDSRCFDPYVKTLMPDQIREVDDAFVLSLNQFATAGPNVTSDACGAITPSVTLDATTDTQCSIGGDLDNPTLVCTLTDTSLNAHTATVTFDNSVGSAVTRQFDFTVTAPAGGGEGPHIGIQASETGEICDIFVSDDGNDNLDCTSHANRCATLTKVESLSPATGSNLCLLLGSTIQQVGLDSFIKPWGGTSADWSFTRCYKMSGSTVVECEDADEANYPIIDGTYDVGDEATDTASNSMMLLRLRDNYQVVERLKFTDSPGRAIGGSESSNGGAQGSGLIGIIVRDIVSEHHAFGTAVFSHQGDHTLFQRIYSNNTGLCHLNANPSVTACTTGAFTGGAIGTVNNGNTMFLDNEVHNHSGEAYGCLTNWGICIYKGNYAGTTGSVSYYFDNVFDGLIEDNIATSEDGTPTALFRTGSRGTWIRRETYGCFRASFDTNGLVRLNKQANAGGFSYGAPDLWYTDCGGWTQGMRFYHNTNVHRGGFSNSGSGTLDKFERLVAVNNVFLPGGCDLNQLPVDSLVDYNNYPSASSDPDCVGANDVIEAENLAGSVWDAFGPGNLATDADFAPNIGAAIIGAAGPLTQTTSSDTGTVIPVVDARMFHDGYDCTDCVDSKMIDGDTIQVGADTGLVVTDRDLVNNTLTVDQSITWLSGEDVCLKTCTADIGWDPDLL